VTDEQADDVDGDEPEEDKRLLGVDWTRQQGQVRQWENNGGPKREAFEGAHETVKRRFDV
jgi:hypothetical protein